MKIICTRQNKDGSFDEVAGDNRFVAFNYKTTAGFIRHGIPKSYRGHKLRIEVYSDYSFYITSPITTIYHIA